MMGCIQRIATFAPDRPQTRWRLTHGGQTFSIQVSACAPTFEGWPERKRKAVMQRLIWTIVGGVWAMSLTRKEIRQKLMEPVGKAVQFGFPNNKLRRGKLLDREVVWSSHHPDADYWDVVDLIEFPEHAHHLWIRFGYYRQVGDRLRWASQTTITEPIHVMKRVFSQTAKRKNWFCKVLVGVFRDAKR
jgi:hypothetical protein